MFIEHINRPVFELDDAHPPKRFLQAFIECRTECVGRELAPSDKVAIDQKWSSSTDGRDWSFSAFAYGFLSTDIELDGFLRSEPCLTESELWALAQVPRFRRLMAECRSAAERSENSDCLGLVSIVERMLDRWGEYLSYRNQVIQIGQSR
jgi:hypothetical protein